MRRRNRSHRFWSNFLILSIIFFIIVSASYALLTTSLHISGNVHGSRDISQFPLDNKSDPNLAFNMALTNSWVEGNVYKYQYHLNLTDIGTVGMDNFQIKITFKNNVTAFQIEGYDYTLAGKVVTIIDNTFYLDSQTTTSMDFVVSASVPNLVVTAVKLTTTTNTAGVGLDKFNVSFVSTDSWDSYVYQYNVTVTNKTGKKITYWQLNITLPKGTSYVSGSNAMFSVNKDILTINSNSVNGYLDINASTTFVLQLSTSAVNYIPNNIKAAVR